MINELGSVARTAVPMLIYFMIMFAVSFAAAWYAKMPYAYAATQAFTASSNKWGAGPRVFGGVGVLRFRVRALGFAASFVPSALLWGPRGRSGGRALALGGRMDRRAVSPSSPLGPRAGGGSFWRTGRGGLRRLADARGTLAR